MISKQENRTYYIDKGRVVFVENDLDNPNRIAVSVSSGTQIQVYDEKLIGFISDGKFSSWLLKGYSTKLARTDAHYIYARLSRTSTDALIIFSVKKYLLDGSLEDVAEEEENQPSDTYYYVRIGEVTATNGTTDRTVTYDSGMLGTTQDVYENAGTGQLNEMFELVKTSEPWYIVVKHVFHEIIINKGMKLLGTLTWGEKLLKGIHTSEDAASSEAADDEHLATSAYVAKAVEGMDEKFLRKDQDDRTPHALSVGDTLTVEQNLQTLDAVLSMLTGRGTIIKDGLIQTDRLEVRGSMTVMDLIINELQGMAADFLFSDVGKVTEVFEDGSSTAENPTYVLTIDKRTDSDITTLSEGDIIQQVVNTLPTGGADYYSSWMRVLSVNQAANSVTCVLYPDAQVPGGKNYPPAAGYNIARRGNAIMPDTADEGGERSQYWMLSSREGRIQFLQNVFKPILEDYNYALTLGKMPDLKALKQLGVKSGEIGLVAETAIVQHFHEFDYNGDVVPKKVDRGEWNAEIAASEYPYRNIQNQYEDGTGYSYALLEQHTVWHMGCRWGCLTDKTTQEPRWNATDWQMLEGYDELSMRFTSSNGMSFHAGKVDTEVTPSVYLGNIDISDDIASGDWSWQYDLGSHAGRVLHITSELIPAGWAPGNPARFICTAYVRVGENQVQEVQNEVIV